MTTPSLPFPLQKPRKLLPGPVTGRYFLIFHAPLGGRGEGEGGSSLEGEVRWGRAGELQG